MGVLRGSGLGKLLLFGEHAAVYGYPAIGIGLPLRTEITYKPESRTGFIGITHADIEVMESLFSYIADHIPGCHIPGPGEWTFTSSIPREAGFGSSAAVCAAIAEILLQHSNTKKPAELKIWDLANRLESFFHGTPSGIDTGLSVLGGMQAFEPHPPELPVHREIVKARLNVIAGSVLRRGNTKELVGGIRERMVANHAPTKQILNRLGDIASTAIELLDGNNVDYGALAKLVNESHDLLGELELNHPVVTEVIESERIHGALCGKTSGAGNGGAFYLLYPTAADAQRAVTRLQTTYPQLTYVTAMQWVDEEATLYS